MKIISRATISSTAENYRHEISIGDNKFHLVADEPPTGHAGPAPYDFVLSGLGACTAITLRMYAQRKGWDLGEVSVTLKLLKDDDGHDHIERSISANGELDDARWAKLLEIADKTPVTRTLMRGTEITTQRA